MIVPIEMKKDEFFRWLYDNNDDFMGYVIRYANHYRIPIDDCLTLALVREVGMCYHDPNRSTDAPLA